jgi:SAM-dependent methyltransferase
MKKQQIYEFITTAWGWIRKGQKIKLDPNKKNYVNLGSALQTAPGWINVDGNLNAIVANLPKSIHNFFYWKTGNKNWYEEKDFMYKMANHKFIHHTLDYGVPFYDNSLDVVYSSHFFEHMPKHIAVNLMKDSYRALKKGGIFRINIPDLEFAINSYLTGNKALALELFYTGDSNDKYSRHYYMYDFEMLKEILESIGFKDVTKCEFQKGNTPDLQILDCRPEMTLFVEAVK